MYKDVKAQTAVLAKKLHAGLSQNILTSSIIFPGFCVNPATKQGKICNKQNPWNWNPSMKKKFQFQRRDN